MNLNELIDEAYSIAKMNGWHNEEHSDSHCLMLIITEIAEAVNADRNNSHADIASFKEIMSDIPSGATLAEHNDWFKKAFENHIKNTVEDELSDVVIRCLDLCGLKSINLSSISFPIENSREHIKVRSKLTFTEWCYDVTQVIARYNKENYPIGYLFVGVLQELCCIAKINNFDLLWHIRTKMNYNRLRGYRHGGKKY